ncbi:MAG: glycosyltransferase family 4 protein [Actinobacteria bacterium]|nr:glycosyltransferase family 4 protein [Actinomycetota bacterium]
MRVTWIHGVEKLRGTSMAKWVESLFTAIMGLLANENIQIDIDELNGISVPFLKGICNRYVLYSAHALGLRADLFHIQDHANAHLVPLLPKASPKIVTVHDIFPLTRPLYDFRTYPFRALNVPGIIKADRIISVSEYMKAQISKKLGYPSERIRVAYCGVDHSLYRPTACDKKLLEKYGMITGARYLLYVGSEIPRKNFPAVLRLLKRLSAKHKDLFLMKVGHPGTKNSREASMRELERLGLRDRVIFCGYVPEAELPAIYSGAAALVAPSFYEGGSGMHVIEAMACGCPVVASGIPQARELCGGAALHCDPHDEEELLEKTAILIENEAFRSAMIEKGLKRAAEFSWEKSALLHVELYRDLVG